MDFISKLAGYTTRISIGALLAIAGVLIIVGFANIPPWGYPYPVTGISLMVLGIVLLMLRGWARYKHLG